jgi:hypothetical protein
MEEGDGFKFKNSLFTQGVAAASIDPEVAKPKAVSPESFKNCRLSLLFFFFIKGEWLLNQTRNVMTKLMYFRSGLCG